MSGTLKCAVSMGLLGVLALLGEAAGAETAQPLPEEKEVSAGSLPSGVTVLPEWEMAQGRKCMLSFAQGKLGDVPFEDDPKTDEEFSEKLQESKRGDVMYDDAEGGALIICSRQARELGDGALLELPEALEPKLERKDFVAAKAGARVLVRTTDEKFAVFRVLGPVPEGLKVQWIYQPDGGTNFRSKGTVADRKLGIGFIVLRHMNDVASQLRDRAGLRVCFEPNPGDKRVEGEAEEIVVKNVTVRSLLDTVVKAVPGYQWELVDGTDILLVFPARGSLLASVPDRDTIKKLTGTLSWQEAVKTLKLDKQGVEFPPSFGRGPNPELPANKNVPINPTEQDTARQILAKICWAYGDGMYYQIWWRDDKAKLYFFAPLQGSGAKSPSK